MSDSLLGVDYSFARPGGAALKERGFSFAMRYCPYPGDQGKGLTAAEVEDLRGNDIAIGVVWESTDGRMFDGYPAGQEDANAARLGLARLGYPSDKPIFFACDRDLIPSMFPYVRDYMQGVLSVLGFARTGIYAEFEVIVFCVQEQLACYRWQTYAWSGGQVYEGYDCYQYLNGQKVNGADVDYDQIKADPSWLWWPEGMDDAMKPEEKELFDAMAKLFGGRERILSAVSPEHGMDYLLGYGMEQAKVGVLIGAADEPTRQAALAAAEAYRKEYNG